MNWRKILAVTTAMAAVGAFTPSTVVQKCVSMVFAAEETVVTVQPTSFTYYQSYDGSKTVENDDGTTSNVTVYCASITGFEGEAAGDIVLPDEIDGMPVKEIGWNFRDADLSNVRSITVTKAFRSGIDYVPANVDIIIPEGNENFILKDGVVYSKNISNVRNEKDDGTYEYVEQTTLELERINSNAPKDFVLPTEIDGIPINGISWGADLSALSSLTVPDDFSDIGISRRVDILFSEKHTKFKTYNGFKYYTDKYTKYEYDENGNYKYDENRNRISTEVTYAEIFGFDGSVKGDVVIPDEIDGTKVEGLDIHGSAWKDKVTSVTLPKYLSSLETINIPDTCGIKTKEGSENFEVSGDFLIDKNGDYRYDSEQEKYVPKSKAIKVLKHLTGEVTIPEDIESMSAVFRGNPDITVINIPASLTYMDKYFCSDMPSLTAFNVDKDNPYYFSVNGALCRRYTWNEFVGYDEETGGPRYENVEHRDLIALPEGYEGEFTTDDDIKLTVCGLAFENCKKVTSVKLGKGTDLDWQFNGFIGCDSLADIELNGSLSYFEKSWIDTTKWYKEAPDGVLYSGTTAVAYKGSETPAEVTIKDGTKQIPWYFVCKGAISELNIPASVEVIGEYVLDHETISAVNVDPANKVYASEDGVLFSKDMKTLKFYPQAKTDSSYTIPDGTELIAAYAFAGNTYLKHVEIPESVEIIYGTIWGGAFEGCTSLEEIKVPSKVKDMDWGELTDCNLKVLDLPETMACYTGHYGLNQWRPGSEVQKWENGGCGAKVERTIFRNAECEISGVKDTIIVGYK
ncbi:MAG: leucine-rich repeat protein, partial [Ruminococcus sp.]|nr:leucine-rich repeat protein [Ruminococcus sp.]